MPAIKKIFDLMCEVFTRAQDKRTAHDQCIAILAKAYKNYDFDEFYEAYERCIKIPLSYVQKETLIENALEFGALFAVKVTPEVEDDDDEVSPFLKRVFDFILEKHSAKLPGVRYRICYFLNLILNSMGDNAYLSDELCNDIIAAMHKRMKDKSAKVRVQAVYALHRMQEPGDDECEVIDAYIYHLAHDPSSDVRKAIIKNIGRNKKTLQSVIERIHDIDYSVRKMAYLFLTKITPKSFKIKQRREILNNGLRDKNDEVSKIVREILLKAWLLYYDNEITKFLYALDTEIATDLGINVLNNLFKVLTVDDLIEQLPLDQDKKLIPIDKLSSENVLFWHCFSKYLQESKLTELFDQTLPELSYFCDHIRQYGENIVNNESTEDEEKITEQAILCQLFEMTKLYDLSDEVGRNRLKQLIEDTLISEIPELKLTEVIVEIYEKVVPNITSRVNTLTHIISDIRMPLRHSDDINLQSGDEEKNDSYTMSKCLGIMCAMLRSPTITSVTPIIRNLFNSVALTSVEHDDKYVQIQALNAVGLCLFLDSELAQKHIPMFFMVFTDSDNDFHEHWIMSLGIIFDLFLKHGLDHFNLVDPADDDEDDDNEKTTSFEASQLDTPNNHVIKMLLALFHYEVPAIQLKAVEGFIKLLLMGRINSVQIVSRLIVLLHNPDYRNPHLKEAVKSFFEYYPLLRKENQKILEKSFLPTILDIFNAPSDSKLFSIDPSIVGHFILDLTRYKIYKTETEDGHYTAHNNISYEILKEIVNPQSEHDVITLIKCLSYVNIKITDEALQNEMLEMCDAVIKELSSRNKSTLMSFKKFCNSIKPNEQVGDNVPEEQEEQEEPEEPVDDHDNIEDDDSDLE
ncbi:hypothetical protein HCN44_001688 [Aphidius gifuensis]|uniref:Nuclear condensin complex subunit 3 C-terminal domain-containing protein n=1 Tax=Aphidius gifuensis TaxID=684658 RepID=A0A834XTT2_APHGI|nr:condensin complex subunit 3-like [Aphidius gifuensis]KAF7992363.1 hypothetical protein HCN44_001688 [Aphidius gifuensis]